VRSAEASPQQAQGLTGSDLLLSFSSLCSKIKKPLRDFSQADSLLAGCIGLE